MAQIRCLLNSSTLNKTTVNEYLLKSGKHITEIITEHEKSKKSIREVYKDELGYPEKVVDKVFGDINVYYPSKYGIRKVAKDGTETLLPSLSLDMLAAKSNFI